MTVLMPKTLTVCFDGKISYDTACFHLTKIFNKADMAFDANDLCNIVSKSFDAIEATFNDTARHNEKLLDVAQEYFETLPQCTIRDEYCPQADEVLMYITTNEFSPNIVLN